MANSTVPFTLLPNNVVGPISEQFSIDTLKIENNSNCWLYLAGGKISDPWQTGQTVSINPTQTVQLLLSSTAPNGQASQTSPTGSCTVVGTDASEPSSSGVISAQNTQAQSQIYIAQNIGPTSGPGVSGIPVPSFVQGLLIANEKTGLGINANVIIQGDQSKIYWLPSSVILTQSAQMCLFNPLIDSTITISSDQPITVVGLSTPPAYLVPQPGFNPIAGQVVTPYAFYGTKEYPIIAAYTLPGNSSQPAGFTVQAADRLPDDWKQSGIVNNSALTITQPAPGVGKKLILTSLSINLVVNVGTFNALSGASVTLSDGNGQVWYNDVIDANYNGTNQSGFSNNRSQPLSNLRWPASPNSTWQLAISSPGAGISTYANMSGFTVNQ